MNMPIIVRLATKADLSNRSAAVALRDFEPLMTAVGQRRRSGILGPLLLYPGDLNRSTQHLLILLDKEVADGDVTDIVHGEAEG